MGLPQIGLEAIYKDAGFQRGIEQFNSGISKATTNAERGASAISRIGSIASGALTVGIGAAVTAFGALTAASKIGLDATLQWGEGLDKLGDMFGMSGEKASAFQYLANKVGLSVDEMGMGLNTLTRGLADMKAAQAGGEMTTAKSADSIQNMKEQLADANTQLERAKKRYAEAKKPTAEMGYAIQDAQKKIARLNADIAAGSKLVPKAVKEASPFEKALKELGISAYNTKGKMKTFDEILPQIMDAFKKLPPSINKSDLAMTLFGARGGSKFLDFLSAGSEGLTDATKKVKELGLELNTTQANAIEDFGFATNELKLGLTGIWNTIGIQVLPIARQFVDFINTRILPAFAQLVREYAPRIIKAFQDFGAVIERDVFPILRNARELIEEFIDAFHVGGLSGVVDEIGNVFTDLFGDFDLAKSLGNLGGKLSKALQDNWPTIQAALSKWGGQFWSWLTGKGGAIEQAGTQLGKVKDAILKWADQNGPAAWDLVGKWASQFWNWITDAKSGVIATIAVSMGNLAQNIENWTADPDTQKRFQDIGKALARQVLQGIGDLFNNPGEGENLLVVLWRTLARAAISLRNAFGNVGQSIARGVIEGIASNFVSADQAARIGQAISTALRNAAEWIIKYGSIPAIMFQLASNAWQQFTASWSKLFSGWNPFASNPTIVSKGNAGAWGGTGEKFADGGPVTRTGMAFVHAGEFVLNRAQVMQLAPVLAGANNSRTFNFTHNWPAGVSSSDRQWTEQMVRTVTHQEIINVLGNA